MKSLRLTLLTLCLLAAGGCSDKASELYDTAQFEEVQRNYPHARQLYERIVRDHAGSDFAAKARDRLEALPTPE